MACALNIAERRFALLLAFITSTSIVAGCRTPTAKLAAPTPAAPPAFVQVAAPLAPSAPQAASIAPPPNVRLVAVDEPIPVGTTAPGSVIAAQRPMQPAPPVQLGLFDAIETALMQNPDLTTLRRNEGVSVGALGVARTYPFNPWVQVQVTPFQNQPGGGSGTTAHYVLVMQTLQLAHQQRHRTENAVAALHAVRWNILQAELNNIATTERLFFTALYLRGLRDLTQAAAEVNGQLQAVSDRQLQAGQATGVDAAIVRLDHRTARKQAALAEANYQTALLDLRRHLNLPLYISCDVVGDLDELVWTPALAEQLLQLKCQIAPTVVAQYHGPMQHDLHALNDLVAGRPDVLAARAEFSASRANVNLAQAARTPDLQIGPYYQRDDANVTFLGFRAQMDVPVHNTGEPLVRQRQAELRQRQTAWEQLHARALIEAQAAIDRYERARRLVVESGDSFREPLPMEFERLEAQFRANEVDVLRVVTARTSLIQVRRAHLDTLNELAQAAAVVTVATGVSPQALIGHK